MLNENTVYNIKDKVFLFTDSFAHDDWKLLVYGYESELEEIVKYPDFYKKILKFEFIYDDTLISKEDILSELAYYKAFKHTEVQILALNDLMDVILAAEGLNNDKN